MQTPINPAGKLTPELIYLTNYSPQVVQPINHSGLQPQIYATTPTNKNLDQCSVIAQLPTLSNYIPNPPTFAQIAAQQIKPKVIPHKQISNNRSQSRAPPRTSPNTPNRNNNNRPQQWNGSPKTNNRNNSSNIQCAYSKKPDHDVRDCRSRPYCKFCGKRGNL